MAKNKIIRFAAGNPNEPFSGLWRMVVSKNDVYLGIGQTMGIFKVSLHESGVWILAATKESGVTFQNENRRAKQWNRPLEHAKGITRGPSIIVPRTSLGSRAIKEKEKSKKAFWFRGPEKGELVEFSLYFVKGKSKTNWASDETVIADIKTLSGNRVVLLASTKPSPQEFLETCENLIHKNELGISNLNGFIEGSFLWPTQSQDHLAVPILVDLPILVKESGVEK